MRLERLTLHALEIALKTSFQHALSARSSTQTLIVELGDETGAKGYGEILPRAYLSGETLAGVREATIHHHAARFVGRTFSGRDDVVAFLRGELAAAGRELATAGGLQLALLDLAGRRFGFPLGSVVGRAPGPPPPLGVVIGFEVETSALAKYCAVLRFSGKRQVKVKVGRADDAERIALVASVLKDVPIRIDANEAYAGAEQAVQALSRFPRAHIGSVEQPLPAADLAGMREVRERTGLKIMADEALVSAEDAERLLAAQAADIFNVRVGKNGGVLGALHLVERARGAGLGVHLGTLVGETGVLTRASELFARWVGGFDYLEGRGQNVHLLADDVLVDPAEAKDGDPQRPGLGVAVDPEKLARYRLADPLTIQLSH